MKHVVIVGCGVVGAAIAYELSLVPNLNITVLDRQPPAQEATGAALGVLMGIISHKTKGRAWALRQTSIQRYETLIPELEAATQTPMPWNRQGILMLRFEGENQYDWEQLAETRHAQGWQLELWDRDQIETHCPHLCITKVIGGIYSPDDRQIDPTALTLALVSAAEKNGVTFRFGVEVENLQEAVDRPNQPSDHPTEKTCYQLQVADKTHEPIAADWVIIAAGLGSTPLTQTAKQPVVIRPVLGQALQVRLDQPMGNAEFQPVITGNDIHVVPLGNSEYWVGATVEFPTDSGKVLADGDRLQAVWHGAIEMCPDLKNATILKTWSGLRPRPDRPAPIVERLSGYTNVWVATGHYRNGVLLAPATALAVRNAIVEGMES